MISGLANLDEDLSDQLIEANVHKRLLKTIEDSIEIYENNKNSLFPHFSTVSDLEKMHKYKRCAAEIKSLGGLVNANDE